MEPILPADRILSEHPRPLWADESLPSAEAVAHVRRPPVELYALGDDDEPVRITPEAVLYDSIDLDRAAQVVRLLRAAEPTVMLDGTRFTLDQADALGRALVALVEAVRGPIDPDEPCATCGTARGEHPSTLTHPWVGADEADAR